MRIAETHGFTLGFGDKGDSRLGRKRDAEARLSEAELGVRLDGDDDAIVLEGDVRIVDVDGAAFRGAATEVVTVELAVGACLVEELAFQRPLQRRRGDT